MGSLPCLSAYCWIVIKNMMICRGGMKEVMLFLLLLFIIHEEREAELSETKFEFLGK